MIGKRNTFRFQVVKMKLEELRAIIKSKCNNRKKNIKKNWTTL